MKIHNDFALTYCTNIHPGESWAETFEQLDQHLPALKKQLAPAQPFGIGLRLSSQASYELLEKEKRDAFKVWLHEHDMYILCINGFPYGNFHQQEVKSAAYAPDWRYNQRKNYTRRLIRILKDLMPDNTHAGISTLPVSYKPWLKSYGLNKTVVFQEAAVKMVQLVKELYQIQQETGKCIYIGIEPEPDGLIENAREVIEFFESWLIPTARETWKYFPATDEVSLEGTIKNFIRICYDVCHFAVNFEDQQKVLRLFASKGIKIDRIQISAALKASIPAQYQDKKTLKAYLQKFQESRYLHQVKIKQPGEVLISHPDLPEALEVLEGMEGGELRSHFHVPVFIEKYGLLRSTQQEIKEVLAAVKKYGYTNVLEVETYTWEVLPNTLKADLHHSIVRELQWVMKNMNNMKNQ